MERSLPSWPGRRSATSLSYLRGDIVRLTYYESVAARMAEPGAGGPATTTVVATGAPEGSKPAGLVRRHNRYGGRVPRLRPDDGRRHLQDAGGRDSADRGQPRHARVRGSPPARHRIAVQFTNALAVSNVETGGVRPPRGTAFRTRGALLKSLNRFVRGAYLGGIMAAHTTTQFAALARVRLYAAPVWTWPSILRSSAQGAALSRRTWWIALLGETECMPATTLEGFRGKAT